MRGAADRLLQSSRTPTLAWPSWWPFLVAVAVTSPFTVYWWALVAEGSVAFDWRIFVEAGRRFHAGSPDLYEITDLYSFRHSPILAMLMPGVAWIGTLGVRLLTLAAAFALPTWPMRIIALASWPLAMDLQHGALIMVIVLAAAWAIRGSKVGAIAFLVLALLSPRPLMLPIVAWLLWHQPWLRAPAVALFVIHALAVLATGYADEWATLLLTEGTSGTASPFNLAPSQLIGRAWIPIAVALAAFLTWRGRPGLAATVINPYVLPHYLLLLLLELVPRQQRAIDR